MSFRYRVLLAIAIVGAGMTAVIAFSIYNRFRANTIRQMGHRILDVGRIGSLLLGEQERDDIKKLTVLIQRSSLPADQLNRKIATEGQGDIGPTLPDRAAKRIQATPEYQRLVQVLRSVKKTSRRQMIYPRQLPQRVLDPNDVPLVEYSWIFVEAPDLEHPDPRLKVFRSIADADYEPMDWNGDGKIVFEEAGLPVGSYYVIEPEVQQFIKAFEGEPTAQEEFYSEDYGTFVSAAVPILDRDGTVLAIMGLDLRAESEADELQALFYFCVAATVAASVLSILVALFLANILDRPLRILRSTAARLREQHPAENVPARDEFGLLTDTYNLLEQEKERARVEAGNQRRQVEDLRRLDEIKSNFVANISHEFRTPLTLILSPLEELIARTPDGSEQEELRLIENNARRLLRLVNNLLDFSQLEARKITPVPVTIALRDYLEKLAANFEHIAARKEIQIRLSGDSEPRIAADPELLEKVFLNLIGNAVKFTERGSIHIAVSATDRIARVVVEDSGIGIPTGRLETIFDRFEQAQTGPGRRHEGSGIGLALAREIVELHHGTIRAETRGSQTGSRFIVELPVTAGEKTGPANGTSGSVDEDYRANFLADFDSPGRKTAALAAAEIDSSGAAAYRGAASSVDRGPVLVVEDNPSMRAHIAQVLSPHFECATAAGGEAALALARRRRPGLFLVDLMMPGLDGFQLIRTLRETRELKNVPVIVLTARTEARDRLEGLSLGADDYLTKPFHGPELILRIKNQLHRQALGDLAISSERDRVYRDLHDHLGASLTDLAIFARGQAIERLGEDHRATLIDLVQHSLADLRYALDGAQDIDKLEQDFLPSLHLILLRRYVNAGRKLNFHIAPDTVEVKDVSLRHRIFTVIREIVSNDLKYGANPTVWKFSSRPEALRVEFESGTQYDEGSRPGRGTGIIERRLADMGGSIEVNLEAGRYSASLRFPLEAVRTKS